jgi:hypothetical protein
MIEVGKIIADGVFERDSKEIKARSLKLCKEFPLY